MAAVERLAILVEANGQGAIREFGKVGQSAERDLGKAESKADKLGARMTSAGAVMMSAAAVMAAGMWNAGQAAADLEQAVGGSEAVFKDSSGAIQEWAKGADKAAGLSEEAALRLTTRLGGALKGLGYEQQAAADQAVELTQIAADLAATYGGTTADAVQALGAAYRGEYDPAEQFNLFLKQSEVDAKAVEMGLAQTTDKVDKYARAQAVTALIMEQSADAQGQFGRELDTTAGRLAVSKAQFENLKAEVGAGFLPVMTKVGEIAGTAASGIIAADKASGGMIGTIAGWGTVILGATGALSFLTGQVISAHDSIKKAGAGAVDFVKKFGLINTIKAAGALAVVGLITKSFLDSKRAAQDAFTSWGGGSGSVDEKLRNARAELDKLNEALKGSQSIGIGPLEIYATSGMAALADNRDAAEDLVKQLEAQKAAAAAAAPYVTNLGAANIAAREATEDHAGAVKALNDTLKAAMDPLFGAINAADKLEESHRSLEEANKKVFWAQVEYDNALKNNPANSLAVQDAAKKLEEAKRGVTDASKGEAAAALEVETNLNTLMGAMQDNPALYQQQIDKINEWERSGRISASTADYMRGRLWLLAIQIAAIPGAHHTDVTVDTHGAESRIQAVINKMAELKGIAFGSGVTVDGQNYTLYGPGLSQGNSLNLRGGRAAGGPLAPWSVYELHDTPNAEVAEVGGSTLLFTGAQGGKVTNLGGQTAGGGPSSSGQATAGRPLVVQLVVDGKILAEVTHPHLRDLDRANL